MRKCVCNLRHYLLFEIGSTGEGCKEGYHEAQAVESPSSLLSYKKPLHTLICSQQTSSKSESVILTSCSLKALLINHSSFSSR